ncbi:hypothetical protein RQN30_10115 [Arcanobacterium hippocoleae]
MIYEAHVVGFTKNFQKLPAEIRGTYAGLGHPETINYLKTLGVTAIELLPIHAKFSEPFLAKKVWKITGDTTHFLISPLNQAMLLLPRSKPDRRQ